MKVVARGPQDGARLVELFGGVRKRKFFFTFPQVLRLLNGLNLMMLMMMMMTMTMTMVMVMMMMI